MYKPININQKKLTYFFLFFTFALKATAYPILSYEEYAHREHSLPYTFSLSDRNQHLFYFGANHSCEPQNEQYPALEKFWNQFLERTEKKDCIVFIEGGLRKLYQNKEDAITLSGGEGGLITLLAHQEDIPVFCPEPTSEYLEQKLLEECTQEIITYRKCALATQQYQRCKKNNPSLDFKIFYEQYKNLPSIEQFQSLHEKIFDKSLDPNDELFFYTILNPVRTDTIINQVCRKASIIRDQQIITFINNFKKQGKNIFIVYGGTHAVMQEPALQRIYQETQNTTYKFTLSYQLKKTEHILRLYMDEALKQLNLTTPQYAVLAQLELNPGISNADLARAAFITPQTMHGIVSNLEKRNLISRKSNPEHGRILCAELTKQGQTLVAQAHELIQIVEKQMFKNIKKADQALLESLLLECFNNLKNINKHEK